MGKQGKLNKQNKQPIRRNSYETLKEMLEQGDFEAAYNLALKNIMLNSSLQLLDLCYQIVNECNDTLSAKTALQLLIQKDNVPEEKAYYLSQLFEVENNDKYLLESNRLLEQCKPTVDITNLKTDNLLTLSQFYIENNQLELALQIAQQAYFQGNLETMIQLCACYFCLNKQEETQQLIQQIWSLLVQQKTIIPLSIEQNNEQYDISIQGNIPRTRFLIGYARILEDYEELIKAQTIVTLALEISPNDVQVLHELAWIKNLQNDYEEAKLLLLKIKQIYVDNNINEDDEVMKDINDKIKQLESN